MKRVLSSLLVSIGFLTMNAYATTADHHKFPQLQQNFTSGSEVTAACLECHTEAASQIHQSPHWTWEFEAENGETYGKRNVINNFCISIGSNEPRCTSCHAGYGYNDDSFDFSSEEAVDCLVCHDTTDTYWKFPTDAGHPNYVAKEWPKGSGNIVEPANLSDIAQSVGAPGREDCGSCHFNGGGGDAVKHGDLDSSLINPSFELDVHMSEEGANLACQDCHTTENHLTDGSRFELTAVDEHGIDIPGHHDEGRASCVSCHDDEPHTGKMAARLNKHTDVLACQSCHIPTFAREKATKTWWDWSAAGRLDEQGKPIAEEDEDGHHTYLSQKGEFEWTRNVVPTYAWFNGEMDYTVVGEKVEPVDGQLALTTLGGSAGDDRSRIWPFKVMQSKQPYDPVNKIMITPHLFGKDDTSFWTNFDWRKAAATGQAVAGQPFSGEIEFLHTTYHWPITHMVAPKEQAVECESCHREGGRLENVGGLLLPGRDHQHWLDRVGWWLVWLSLAAVILHGFGRLITAKRK
ncbi:MAG: tetrathionate reductase family octaheme c-type cytochrome [Reinekea sp.]